MLNLMVHILMECVCVCVCFTLCRSFFCCIDFFLLNIYDKWWLKIVVFDVIYIRNFSNPIFTIS